MYKFIKIKCGRTGLISSWLLECNDIITLQEHNEKYMHNVIEDGIKDVFDVNKKHLNTHYGKAIKKVSDTNCETLVETSIRLENIILNSKINSIIKFGHILLRENGSYTIHSDEDEIIEELLLKNLIYPNYTLDDIRIMQWQGGVHYYAKIGNLDVYIDGKTKWNTHEMARKKAEEYFYKLNHINL